MFTQHYTFNPRNTTEILTAGDYDVHTMANIVPLDSKTDALEESIRRTGLLQPLMMYKGAIIDGRRRAIACKKIGIIPHTHDVGSEGDISDKVLYDIVLAANTRRNVNKGQKAIIAAFQTDANAHKLAGYKTALEYAKTVWDVSPVVYKRAKYITKNGGEYAIELFNSGYATVEGKQLSMNKVWQWLKQQQKEEVVESRVAGDQSTAMVYQMISPMKESMLKIGSPEAVLKALTMLSNEIRKEASAEDILSQG